MKTKPHLAVLALLAALSGGSAYASNVTFNELAHDDDFRVFAGVTSNGYTVSNDCASGADCLGAWGRSHEYQADVGHTALFTNYEESITTLRKLGGGMFNLASIDLADYLNSGASVEVSFDFRFMDGAALHQVVLLDYLPGLQTFAFNLMGLESVSWQTTGGANYLNQFDSIVTVPEPQGLALVLAALGGAGLVSRRRKAASDCS